MKKLLIITAAAAMLAPTFAAETAAEWDFTKEQLTSGKYTLYKRGDAAFVKDEKSGKSALLTCAVGKAHGKGCGLTLKGDPRQELLPMDGFEVQTRVRYKDPAAGRIKGANMYIFDAAYATKNGVALLLHITSRGEFAVRVIYGDGSKQVHNVIMAPMFGDGEWHDLALKYVDDQIKLSIDGKEVKTIIPPKPITDSTVRFTVGDRVAAGYQPFSGLIEYVKIIKY